ncbi:MAG: hypothetical protein PHT89_06050 [Lachnospiraceae bacterium]|nr:hypothetical protein [Lachnospiraceae bacterium]MDD3660274.1 hypothetical protein [Lachnospiraceae bacterium]
MLNEERIILMTHMASYEENEGRKNVAIGSYFRGDYIGLQLLKSVISGTIAYALVVALIIFYDFGTFMQDIYKTDLMELAKTLITYYLGSLVIYIGISYAVYFHKYNQAKKSLKNYYNHLKQLSYLYEEDGKK